MSTQSEEKAICDALKILFDIKNTGNEMKEKAEKLMMNIKISEMKSLPKEMIYIILHSHCNLSKLYHRTLEIVKCLMTGKDTSNYILKKHFYSFNTLNLNILSIQ